MRLGITGVLLVLGLVAGCGGSDDDGSSAATDPAGTGTGAPQAVVLADPAAGAAAVAATRRYLDAFVNGQAEQVCALQSPAFSQGQIDRAASVKFVKKDATCLEFVKKVVSTSKKANATTGPASTYLVTAIEATASRATVKVEYPVTSGAVPDSYVLVRRNGAWVVDANESVPTS